MATAEDGYEFAGWYDGETLICETENFTVENVVEDKTYTAQFKEDVCNHSHDGVEYKPWKNSKALPLSAGNYYLATDVTISQDWTAPAGEVNLCLNGKSINLNSKHIAVENGATLNIYDCGDTVRYYDADSITGKWTLKSEGTSDYTTEGGVITGGSNTIGGAISVNDATLNLYGGNLAGNTASSNNGGAVYITKGTLTIDGANILGNYAYCNGGGVFANQSTVTINDGRISYNRACITDNKGGDGGGIYLSNCTTTMNGASITHNTNLYDGAGIMNSAGGTLTVNGGTISDNTTTFWGEWSDYCGGTGICNDSDSTLILNDGTIANNIGISNGAGVFNRGTFNMNGGTIEGNICVSLADNIYKGYGDGVMNEAGAVFTMTDGYIGVIHNDLVKDDTCRGVYNRGTFTMTGGEIFASSDDMSSCYGLSNSSDYSADGTETSSAVANIGGNAVITGQCGYKPFAVNGTGTVNVSGNAVLTAKNVNDCKDNRSRAIYLSRGTLNVSGNPELISLHDFSSSNPPDTNGIRFEPSVTVNLSGGPVINAVTHIQLEGTPSEPSKYFNIVGKLEKPVSPYVVVKRVDTDLSEGAFTNGWTEYMSDAEHDDYFTGPEGYGVLLYENELRLAEHAHKNIIYSAWEEIDSLPTTAGNYRLESDVTISETWNVPAGVTNLCLNGHKITYTGNSIAINLADNVELNVTDCIDSGMLYAESEEDFIGEAYTGIWMSGGKFTMDSGKIYVKNTYPKANARAIVARVGASLTLSGEAEVEAYCSGAPFGICAGSEATVILSDDAYIYAENIDPSARDGRARSVYGETGAVINIYGSPVIEAYSPSTTNAVNAIRLNGSTAVFNGTPALIANTDSGLAAEVHCEKTTDLISVNCNLENDTIYRVYKPSNGVITTSENTEYNDASKFASAIDGYKVTKESDGQLYIVEVSYYTITAVATEGGNAEGTSTVKEGESVTLNATANEEYEFIGWFDGENKVCETEEFVVENVTEDKTYIARFEVIGQDPVIPDDVQPVCYIDSEGYTSLSEAVSAAKDGDVIWMTANDNLSGNITITQSITIELEGYNLPNACIKFEGNIDVKLNDRVGTAVLNSNHNIGYKITNDFSSDSRPRGSFYLTGGADVTISGATGGTKFYGGTNEGLPKAFVVGKGCSLTVNGGTMVYEGGYGSDGIFVCDTGVLTLNDILIDRYTNDKNGSSLSYANVPTTENPLTIKKGHFYGGMWVEGSATINGVSISYGTLTFEKIEKALLYTSEGSYIDYDKSTSANGWEIYIASNSLSTDTEIDNEIDATEALRVSAGGDVVAQVGQKVVFQPQVTGGDGATEITYMWEKDGADSGVTTNIYTIETATIDDAGEYVFTATQGNTSVSCVYVLSVEGTDAPEQPDEPENPDVPAKKEYTITAVATEGGNAEGTSTVKEGESVTLNATANEEYEFIGWFDGENKVCETEEFVVENVTEDKTYTAKFEKVETEEPETPDVSEEPDEPSSFDFESIRTENGKNITVDHANKKIYVEVDDSDHLMLYVHQKEYNPGATIKMKSYNGNTVKYNSTGVYRIYTVNDQKYVTVFANVTIGGVTEVYDITVNFVNVEDPANKPFTSIRTANGKNIVVDHENKKINVEVDDSNCLLLYVHQKEYNPGATIKMKSYNGYKVNYDPAGSYKIYTIGGDNVTVTTKVTKDDVTEIYDLEVKYNITPFDFTFDTIKCDNAKDVIVDHNAQTIKIIANDDAKDVFIYHQQEDIEGKIKLTNYMNNRVSYDSTNQKYQVCFVNNNEVSTKAAISLGGITKEYTITTVFTPGAWGFDDVKADNASVASIDHEAKAVTMNVDKGCNEITLYIDQKCEAGNAQIWMKSYNGNKVIYNSSSRTYTIKKGTSDSLTVSTKITMLGETRYYDITFNFSA